MTYGNINSNKCYIHLNKFYKENYVKVFSLQKKVVRLWILRPDFASQLYLRLTSAWFVLS